MSAPRSVPTTSTPSRPGRSSIVTSASIPMSSRSSLSTGTAAASSSERTGAASSRSSSRSSRCSRSASGRRGTSASSTVGCGSGSRSSSWNERSTRASSPPIPSMFAGFPFSRTSMSPSRDEVLLHHLEDRRRDVVEEDTGRQLPEEDERDERQVVGHRLHRSLGRVVRLRRVPRQRHDRRDELQQGRNDRQDPDDLGS